MVCQQNDIVQFSDFFRFDPSHFVIRPRGARRGQARRQRVSAQFFPVRVLPPHYMQPIGLAPSCARAASRAETARRCTQFGPDLRHTSQANTGNSRNGPDVNIFSKEFTKTTCHVCSPLPFSK